MLKGITVGLLFPTRGFDVGSLNDGLYTRLPFLGCSSGFLPPKPHCTTCRRASLADFLRRFLGLFWWWRILGNMRRRNTAAPMKGARLRVMQAEPPAAQRGRQTLARLSLASQLHSDGLVEHIHATAIMDGEKMVTQHKAPRVVGQ